MFDKVNNEINSYDLDEFDWNLYFGTRKLIFFKERIRWRTFYDTVWNDHVDADQEKKDDVEFFC